MVATHLKYTAKHMPNQLTYGTGNTVVVTGWTDRKAIARNLDPSEYAAIGQLYSSTRGISFLFRNLFANPQVRDLVVVSATQQDRNSGACQCLKDFFEFGFSRGVSDSGLEAWIINSSVKGFIDIEISESALNQLRKVVTLHWFEDRGEAIAHLKFLSHDWVPLKPWGEPREFPLKEVKPTIKPGDRYGHLVKGATIAETWVKLIHLIKSTGTITPCGYEDDRQELIDTLAVIQDEPEDFYVPSYLPCDREAIANYIPLMLEDAPYTEGVKYTYAQRLRSWFGHDQIELVIQKLLAEIDSTSATMSLWDAGGIPHQQMHEAARRNDGDSDHHHGGSPCLNHIWIRIVNGKELSLTAVFRSHDMFNGWVVNAFGLRALQMYIREEFQKRSGMAIALAPLCILSQSAHIYASTWEYADKLIADQHGDTTPTYNDPVGNFLISIDSGFIEVQQITPAGEAVATWCGNDPLKLVRQVCIDCPGIQDSHAAYLGLELGQAAIALKLALLYEQDKPLKVSSDNR